MTQAQMLGTIKALKKENKALRKKLSYLPKVPSKPYVKRLAKRLDQAERSIRIIETIIKIYKKEV